MGIGSFLRSATVAGAPIARTAALAQVALAAIALTPISLVPISLAAIALAADPAQASPWAEVGDNQLRSDIELLAAAGVFDDVTTHWPLPWRSILAGLSNADLSRQPPAVQAAAERVLREGRAATAPGFLATASADATNSAATVYGFDGMGRGQGQAQLSLEGNGGIFSGRAALGAITGNFRGDSFKLMPDGSYLSLRLGGALVYAGYLDHWWGPGQISALSLSNNARPMPQIGIERAGTEASSWPILRWLGPWQVELMLGYLDGPRIQPDTYYNAARFTFHPVRGLEIGVSRTEEFCGQGHACVPLRDYFHFANNPSNPNATNDQSTLDIKYANTLGGVPFQAYMQLMNEDYTLVAHSGTSHLFGASIFVPTAANPVKLTAEYTNSIATLHPFAFGDDMFGFSYTNYSYPDGMRYRGRTLGFSLDDDSTLLSLQGSWTDPGGRFYELSFHHAAIGTSRTPAGANIVSTAPVLMNVGAARVGLPLMLGGQGIRLDLEGRLSDDQPRPHHGFAAGVEAAIKIGL